MLVRFDMTRVMYGFISLAILQTAWISTFFANDQNVYNVLGAGVGALVARFFYPKVPIRISIGGWLVGFLVAMIYARSIFNAHFLHAAIEEYAVFATVAMATDAVVQIIAWVFRLGSKGGKYVEENPKEALDDGLETGGKILTFWVKWKTPALELLDLAKQFFKSKS